MHTTTAPKTKLSKTGFTIKLEAPKERLRFRMATRWHSQAKRGYDRKAGKAVPRD